MKPEQQHKKMTQNEQDGSSDQSNPSWTCKVSNVFTWHLMKILLMGQGLSVMICATALTSQYLASDFHFNTPMLQSFVLYVLLCMTYTTTLIFKEGDGNILQILKKKWWKYILLSLTDVEANYTVVKAYQYTTLTSVQLLDCFVIPVIMLLSWLFLKTHYRVLHLVAVCVCLMGVGAMVGADLLTGRDQGSSSNILLGDVLILISATLYGISNVCQEYTVKHLSRAEFLGMLGLFGTIISGIQLGILEHRIVAVIQWSWQIVLLLGGYSLGMYGLYSFMPIVVKMSSAAAVNLSLLTADIFSVICGIFLFHYAFSGLHIMSLVLIFVGFIMFHSVPMPNPSPEAHSEDGGCENNAFDEEGSLEEVAAQASENTEDQGSDCKERTCNSPLENPAVSVVKCSVKL